MRSGVTPDYADGTDGENKERRFIPRLRDRFLDSLRCLPAEAFGDGGAERSRDKLTAVKTPPLLEEWAVWPSALKLRLE